MSCSESWEYHPFLSPNPYRSRRWPLGELDETLVDVTRTSDMPDRIPALAHLDPFDRRFRPTGASDGWMIRDAKPMPWQSDF